MRPVDPEVPLFPLPLTRRTCTREEEDELGQEEGKRGDQESLTRIMVMDHANSLLGEPIQKVWRHVGLEE